MLVSIVVMTVWGSLLAAIAARIARSAHA